MPRANFVEHTHTEKKINLLAEMKKRASTLSNIYRGYEEKRTRDIQRLKDSAATAVQSQDDSLKK